MLKAIASAYGAATGASAFPTEKNVEDVAIEVEWVDPGSQPPISLIDADGKYLPDFIKSKTGLIQVTLPKPLGIIFQPIFDQKNSSIQQGTRVSDLPRTGAAAKSRRLEVGDELFSINGKKMYYRPFDEIMDAIIDADPEEVKLLFRRPHKETLSAAQAYKISKKLEKSSKSVKGEMSKRIAEDSTPTDNTSQAALATVPDPRATVRATSTPFASDDDDDSSFDSVEDFLDKKARAEDEISVSTVVKNETEAEKRNTATLPHEGGTSRGIAKDSAPAKHTPLKPPTSTTDIPTRSEQYPAQNVSREDLISAIESEDWAAVGAVAALLAATDNDNNDDSVSRRSSVDSLDAARAAELDHMVENGDWEGLILASSENKTEEEEKNIQFSLASDIATYGTNQKEAQRSLLKSQVEQLLKQVAPGEIQNIAELMEQFGGREMELIETLRTMKERAVTAAPPQVSRADQRYSEEASSLQIDEDAVSSRGRKSRERAKDSAHYAARNGTTPSSATSPDPNVAVADFRNELNHCQDDLEKCLKALDRQIYIGTKITNLSGLADNSAVLHTLVSRELVSTRENRAIMNILSSEHRDFYMMFMQHFQCSVRAYEALSTNLVSYSDDSLRQTVSKIVRHGEVKEKRKKSMRQKLIALAGMVGKAAKEAGKQKIFPYSNVVGSIVHFLLTLPEENLRRIGTFRVAEFSTELQAIGVAKTIERTARTLVYHRMSSPIDFENVFFNWKKKMNWALGDQINTRNRMQACCLADIGLVYIMESDKTENLWTALRGQRNDEVYLELASAILEIDVSSIQKIVSRQEGLIYPDEDLSVSSAITSKGSTRVRSEALDNDSVGNDAPGPVDTPHNFSICALSRSQGEKGTIDATLDVWEVFPPFASNDMSDQLSIKIDSGCSQDGIEVGLSPENRKSEPSLFDACTDDDDDYINLDTSMIATTELVSQVKAEFEERLKEVEEYRGDGPTPVELQEKYDAMFAALGSKFATLEKQTAQNSRRKENERDELDLNAGMQKLMFADHREVYKDRVESVEFESGHLKQMVYVMMAEIMDLQEQVRRLESEKE